jgi:peptide/nickel transport system substrate-binding protein
MTLRRRQCLRLVSLGLGGGLLSGVFSACGATEPSGAPTAAPTVAATVGSPTPVPTPTGRVAAATPTAASVPVRPIAAATTTPNSTATASSTPAAAAAAPRRGGTLHFGNIGDFLNLEPQAGARPDGNFDQLYCIWDQLLTVDANGQSQPMLAENWELSGDSHQIKFSLRRGVQFHTGRELTADDVKFSLQRIQDPKSGSALTGRAAPISGIETPDRYTVVVTASRPWVEAFDLFMQANVVDPVTLLAAGLSKPTGTGGFMFAEYAQGDHLRLVKNPNYWRSGLPYLDEILVSIHADAQTAVVQLDAGALDVISYGLPVTDMLRLRQDPHYQVLINDRTGSSRIAILNCTRAPTDNKLVRQALSYALDRQRMTDTIWHGLGQPIVLPWSQTSPAYDAAKNGAYFYDLERARALIAQAGVTNTHLEIMWSAGPAEFGTVAQIYQADLTQIGFDVTLKPLEGGAYLAARTSVDYQGIQLATFTTGQLNPASATLGPTLGPQSNVAGFKDDAYTQLVNQVVSETDPVRQHELYVQLNDYYLDQSWMLTMVPFPEQAAAQANVRGLRYDSRPALITAEIWLA